MSLMALCRRTRQLYLFLLLDINECVEGTHLCDQHQSCLNTNGSFECHCKLGYELETTTGACVGEFNIKEFGHYDIFIET